MESVPGALAPTPIKCSSKSRLPLERGLHFQSGSLKAGLQQQQQQRLPLDTSSQFNYSGAPRPGRSPKSGRALSLETSSQFSPVGDGPATTTTAPARYFIVVYFEAPRPERPRNAGRAISLETSSRFSQICESPAATTTAPARYFLVIYCETPRPAGSLAWRPWRRGAHTACNAECFSQELV